MWTRLSNQLTSDEWNEFVKKHGPLSGRFLQSWEWGEFQGVQRLVCEGDGVASVSVKKLSGFGTYAYCPRGPIVETDFFEAFQSLAKAVGPVLFFRSDFPIDVSSTALLKKSIDLQPSHTWITDLSSTWESIFSAMHHKTRYNIRLAERHGVRIEFDSSNFDEVWPLFEGTSGRGKFRLHEKRYYQEMLDTLRSGDCRAYLVTASYEDKPIAANIMIDFAGVRTYLHGASSYEHRALMAPYLLHWVLMKDAIEQKMTQYDWWGVAGGMAEKAKRDGKEDQHPWAGISRFKRSFPGRDLVYPGTYDLIQKQGWYKLYELARQLRRGVRRSRSSAG